MWYKVYDGLKNKRKKEKKWEQTRYGNLWKLFWHNNKKGVIFYMQERLGLRSSSKSRSVGVLVSESDDVTPRSNRIGRSICSSDFACLLCLFNGELPDIPLCLACVCLAVFGEICLRFWFYFEVRENGLARFGLSFADIGHLECFFPQLPFIPAVVRVQSLLNEMRGGVHTLIDHQLVGELVTAILGVQVNAQIDVLELLVHSE